MTAIYNKYYTTENLFGEPYAELIEFFTKYPKKGDVLDLGCGQGRNAIALAQLGYSVTGIDNSIVGIEQMNQAAKAKNLNLIGQLGDIYAFDKFNEFDIILLDSMFHFTKKDVEKETGLIKKIVSKMKNESLIVVCIQDTKNKVEILNHAINHKMEHVCLANERFKYIFEDKSSGHKSATNYRLIAFLKDA